MTPLTMTQEREDGTRSWFSHPGSDAAGKIVLAELDATRAALAEEVSEHVATASAYLDAHADAMALGAKLAEAEAIVAQSHCDLVALNTALAASEARCAALVEALTECSEYFDRFADVRDGEDGHPAPNASMLMQQLCVDALAAAQGTKGGEADAFGAALVAGEKGGPR